MEPKKLRIAAATPTGFRHEGFDLTEAWTEVNYADLTDEQKKALRSYQRTHIKVHPDDQAALDESLKSLPADQPAPGTEQQVQGQPKRDALSQGQPIPGQGGYEIGAETPDDGATRDPSKTDPGKKPPLQRR